MKVAAIYDVHGNLPALEATLVQVRSAKVDRIIVGGDVLPGPMPAQTLDALLTTEIPVSFIYGNGERAVLASLRAEESTALPEAARAAIRWTGDQLSAEQRDALADWPATVRVDIPGLGSTVFCHATPRDENEIFTRRTPASVLEPIFAAADADLVVCGHTHMQFDRVVGTTRVINAGSVGMPFGGTGAHWCLLGPSVEFRRTKYDAQATAALIRETGYPGADALAENNVLTTPAEEFMLDTFDRAAITGR